ncbi:unnamed protein product [Ectocarpus sp. CCAP 1310/34]|nr:unnamed protein product [Ectocarpus sp. CCAP 1310/34]
MVAFSSAHVRHKSTSRAGIVYPHQSNVATRYLLTFAFSASTSASVVDIYPKKTGLTTAASDPKA